MVNLYIYTVILYKYNVFNKKNEVYMDNLYDFLDELSNNIYVSNCLLECVSELLKNDYGYNEMPDIFPIIDICLKNNKDSSKIFDNIERIIYQKAIKISQQ